MSERLKRIRNDRTLRRAMVALALVMILPFAPSRAVGQTEHWESCLGGGVYVSPVYPGSDTAYAVAMPYARVVYTRNRISCAASLLDGLGITYTNEDNGLITAVSMNTGDERNSRTYTVLGETRRHSEKVRRLLDGTPTVSTGLRTEIMLGLVSQFGVVGWSLDYHPTRQSGDGHRLYHGFLSSFRYSIPVNLTRKLTVTGSLSLDLMDRRYAEAWYSIRVPTRSLDRFSAGEDLKDIQLVVQVDYMVTGHIGATFLAGSTRYLNDAQDSPYTTSSYTITSCLYGFYRF